MTEQIAEGFLIVCCGLVVRFVIDEVVDFEDEALCNVMASVHIGLHGRIPSLAFDNGKNEGWGVKVAETHVREGWPHSGGITESSVLNLFEKHKALHHSSKNDMMNTPPLLPPDNNYHTPQAEIIQKRKIQPKSMPLPWVLSLPLSMPCSQYSLCTPIAPLEDSYIASRDDAEEKKLSMPCVHAMPCSQSSLCTQISCVNAHLIMP